MKNLTLGLACCFIACVPVVVQACAARQAVCPTIRILSDACPLFMVELPDGTKEPVAKERIAGLAFQARSARMAAEKGPAPADGGAE